MAPSYVGVGKQQGKPGEKELNMIWPVQHGPANTCTTDQTKALKMERGRLVFSMTVPLNEQKNG